MKKIVFSFAIASMAVLMSSCALLDKGVLFEGNTAPYAVTSNPTNSQTKVGRSSYISVIGLIKIGDGGISAAAKNAGINKISYVDVQTTSVLGLFSKKETIVYGE